MRRALLIVLAAVVLPSPVFPQSTDAGRQVFATRCAACHGTEGAGGELGSVDRGAHSHALGSGSRGGHQGRSAGRRHAGVSEPVARRDHRSHRPPAHAPAAGRRTQARRRRPDRRPQAGRHGAESEQRRDAAARRRPQGAPAARERRQVPRGHVADRLAHLQRPPERQPLQPAHADHRGERVAADAEVDLQPAERVAAAGDAGGGGRRDVRDQRQRFLRARRRERPPDLELPAAAHARPHRRVGARRQPRRGRGRRPRVRGHRSRPSHRAEPCDRRAALGNRDGGLEAELQRHRRADDRGQPGDLGHRRRRRRRARLRGGLRPDHRERGVALLGRAEARRARIGDVEGQRHRPPRRGHLDDRQLRPGPRHPLLGDGQSRPRHDWRRTPGRQPLLGFGGGARRQDRAAQVALPVHAARRARLRRAAAAGAGGRAVEGAAAQAPAAGQPQRLLLRARSRHRRVSAGNAVREADHLGVGTRCQGPAHRGAQHGADARGQARVPVARGRVELVFGVVQPADRVLLRADQRPLRHLHARGP